MRLLVLVTGITTGTVARLIPVTSAGMTMRSSTRTANGAMLYLILGLLGVLPLVLLTPPFQVPDEQEHFYRAFQFSELSFRGEARGDAAGAVLPASLPELAERFLGTRVIYDGGPVRVSPLSDTLPALAIPLDPSRREFVDFSGAAFYAPLPYLPQIAAIVIGRASGLGPLGLLYAARLANGVAALLLVAAALWILPVGNMALLVMGLTPMVLFEFASASPDAAVIATAFLFTAIATRARFRGRWHGWEVLTACIAGAVYCSLKPVYAPLLLIGLPGALRFGLARHVIAVHAIIIVVVLGVTAAWLHYGLPSLLVTREGTSVSRQLTEILAHPVTFVITMLRTVEVYGRSWVLNAIGLLGWLTIPLPRLMYVLPMASVALSLLSRPPAAPRISVAEAMWHMALFGASAVLILTALYLHFTVVGAGVIEGVQGRYFCPLSALLAVTLGGLAARLPPMPGRLAKLVRLAMPVMLAMVVAEMVLTSGLVARAYRVF